LTYKYKFREIIEKELTKNKTIRTYFDEWGGRCYIFTDELGKHYMFKKNSKKTLKNLELNMDAFKELGGLYIFSAVPIENAKENHLLLERTFQSDLSVWKIYLYKVL
ncbi:membrane protein, partial [Bacillus sp. SA1-12]